MSDANDLVGLLQRMQKAAQSQLTQYESGSCKLYITGPGGASIDGTPQYLGALKQQLSDLKQALSIAGQLVK